MSDVEVRSDDAARRHAAVATEPARPRPLGDPARLRPARHHRLRRERLPLLPGVDQPLLHRPERGRDRDHCAPADVHHHHRGDRPLGGVDARPHGARHGRALPARLADLARDDRGCHSRGDPRRLQRLPDHTPRVAVARGDDRDADALSRHRAGNPAHRHDQRVPAGPCEHRRHSDSAYAHLVLGPVLPRARGRLRDRPPCDAAGTGDLRHRRESGSRLLLGYPRQADQVLAVRALGSDVRIRGRALVAPVRLRTLRLRASGSSSSSSRWSSSAGCRSSAVAARLSAWPLPSPFSARSRRQ